MIPHVAFAPLFRLKVNFINVITKLCKSEMKISYFSLIRALTLTTILLTIVTTFSNIYLICLLTLVQMPISYTEEKFACCLWCRNGPMKLVLRIDRSGFVPGEKMLINAECINMTNNDINHTKAKIEQVLYGVCVPFVRG